MKVAITGAGGFLGWHTACRLRAMYDCEPRRVLRPDFDSVDRLAASLTGCDTVIHLAGVNRAESDAAVEQGNIAIAQRLADAIVRAGRPVHLVYGNSIQSARNVPYGRGKARAHGVLAAAIDRVGGTYVDVRLPNVFGEHGRPFYNSFVATFCHEIAAGRQPSVTEDRQVPLLHAQAAADELVKAALHRETHDVDPVAPRCAVSAVRDHLLAMHHAYSRGEIPDLSDSFTADLFNTYRSHTFPGMFPFSVTVHGDARGRLFEAVRCHGGQGQSFVSTTVPGARRGDHYHLRKMERFLVVKGRAEIALRRLYDDAVVRFTVSGSEPAFVDMPTLWVHNITNVGAEELLTMFWSDQLFDPESPDQYAEDVEPLRESSR